MNVRLLFVILPLLGLSVFFNRPTHTQDVPPSVLRAFIEDHPTATLPNYHFEADDAGIVFLVNFEEAGTKMSAEYRYDERAWLGDLESEIASTSLDEDLSVSTEGDLRKTRF